LKTIPLQVNKKFFCFESYPFLTLIAPWKVV
jgi:hypothetical protein